MPRVLGGGRLDWHPLRSDHQCHPGAFGLREPDPEKVPGGPLPPGTLLLVPGLGFAVDGRRLGQGGGFYDRLLAGFTGTAVGIGYDCQRCDDLPTQAHDRRLDGLILGGVLVLDPRR
jgi:5-formyltetrahydrofolate cyclo-ligase